MSLSILSIGKGANTHSLYCSDLDSIIMTGTQWQLEWWKDLIETCQQKKANAVHFAKLKEDYIKKLVEAGNSEDEANSLLKKKMPFLYENKVLLKS